MYFIKRLLCVLFSAPAGVVHFTGGVCGLAGTVILGPRRGRFENPEEFEYHNIPLRPAGTFSHSRRNNHVRSLHVCMMYVHAFKLLV